MCYTWLGGNTWVTSIFIILILLLVGSIIKDSFFKKEETPLEILKKRYARGDIYKKEFEEKKKDLVQN